MNINEFSDAFDALASSYLLKSSFGGTGELDKFDEYEKSVFLTDSQENLVIQIYSGRNNYGGAFENTEEIRKYLENLINTVHIQTKSSGHAGLSKNSVFYDLPENVWFITYESVYFDDESLGCLNGTEALVVPITQDEYYKVRRNPFRGPSENRVLRLDAGQNLVELISKYDIEEYVVRYMSRPSPIILTDLPENLSINGISNKSECCLNDALHWTILEMAVKQALQSRGATFNTNSKQ